MLLPRGAGRRGSCCGRSRWNEGLDVDSVRSHDHPGRREFDGVEDMAQRIAGSPDTHPTILIRGHGLEEGPEQQCLGKLAVHFLVAGGDFAKPVGGAVVEEARVVILGARQTLIQLGVLLCLSVGRIVRDQLLLLVAAMRFFRVWVSHFNQPRR